MNIVLNALHFFMYALVSAFIFMFGMMHAYFPINDQDTSTGHRIFWWIVTLVLIVTLWRSY